MTWVAHDARGQGGPLRAHDHTNDRNLLIDLIGVRLGGPGAGPVGILEPNGARTILDVRRSSWIDISRGNGRFIGSGSAGRSAGVGLRVARYERIAGQAQGSTRRRLLRYDSPRLGRRRVRARGSFAG